ncbi:MAG: phosphatidylglycerophosphatase A [Phycisphaerae bacterium]
MGSSLKKLLVTGLGTGYLPIAPGTWGSLAVAVVFAAVGLATGADAVVVNLTMVGVLVASSGVCVALGKFTEETFGGKDPGKCSTDEFAGQALALLGVPFAVGGLEPGHSVLAVAALGFGAFRFFDILKPPPARQIEKLPRGWGVLCDDLVAGVYANIVSQLVWRLVF